MQNNNKKKIFPCTVDFYFYIIKSRFITKVINLIVISKYMWCLCIGSLVPSVRMNSGKKQIVFLSTKESVLY